MNISVIDFLSRCEWVVAGPAPHLATCTRCEATAEPPSLPVGIEALVAWMNGFAAEHSGCRQPSDGNETPLVSPGAFVDAEPLLSGLRAAAAAIEAAPAAVPATEVSKARKLQNGGLFFDCKVHGTSRGVVRGAMVHCGHEFSGVQKCEEAVAMKDVQEVKTTRHEP